MKETLSLRFTETSLSVENLRKERLKNRVSILNELNWNNYEKIRIVGKGAFGTAVLYRKKSDGLLVVLKEINMNDLSASERQLAINEVQVLSIVSHANIISYYDSFENNGDLFIEMEYADAGTLADFLAHLTTPLQEHEILLIFRQIVSAISYLHDNNILHRDIKTANIFLNKEGYIKVGDFGISKMLTSRREAETCVGTPYYISPEICEGKLYNQKSDIWALGCVLYEMACLQKTFEGSNLPALINKIVKGQFTPVKRNYSLEFRNLIKELLAKNPDIRPHANVVMKSVSLLLNKLQLDRYRLWTQYNQEVHTFDLSTSAMFASSQNNSTVAYMRSLVYEVNLKEPNIKLSPLLLPSRLRIKELSKSVTHFLALSFNGAVYSWGCGLNGQLGLGESVKTTLEMPVLIETIRNRNIVGICAGDGFSVFVSKNGLVMTCGDNKSSCLGRSDTTACFTPKLVDSLLCADITNVSCGSNHVVAVSGEGKVYSWGCNVDGRLGIGRTESYVALPNIINFANDVVIKHVFCGHDSTAFIDEKGSVWMCGNNDNNKLGLNERHQFRTIKAISKSMPTKLKWLKHRVHSLSLGKTHSAFLVEGGKVITCGHNCDAQLGMGHVKPLYMPRLVRHLAEQSVVRVQTGSCFTIASNNENILYFWGSRYLRTNINSENLNCETQFTAETIKLGESNQSLMNVVESVGPDFPIVQIRDPQIVIDNLNDLSLLTSSNATYNRDVILKPQAIVSLYASPVSLHSGEIIGLANVYCFADDCIYIIIDTTIPLLTDSSEITPNSRITRLPQPREKHSMPSINNHSALNQQTENIPEWIRQEISSENNLVEANSSDSLSQVLNNNDLPINEKIKETHLLYEENKVLKAKLQESQKVITKLQNQVRELENERLKRKDLNKKFYLCSPCSIQ